MIEGQADKSCPFCNRAQLGLIHHSKHVLQIKCLKCEASGPTAVSEKQAWIRWDRRIDSAYVEPSTEVMK